jgi:hypothetical protein
MEKVTKQTSGGKSVYRDENGEAIVTYTEQVEDIVGETLEPLRDFLDMLHTADVDDIGRAADIAEALLERADKKISRALKYLRENFGTVEIEAACFNQTAKVEPETMLGVVFKPCGEVQP